MGFLCGHSGPVQFFSLTFYSITQRLLRLRTASGAGTTAVPKASANAAFRWLLIVRKFFPLYCFPFSLASGAPFFHLMACIEQLFLMFEQEFQLAQNTNSLAALTAGKALLQDWALSVTFCKNLQIHRLLGTKFQFRISNHKFSANPLCIFKFSSGKIFYFHNRHRTQLIIQKLSPESKLFVKHFFTKKNQKILVTFASDKH